MGRPSSEVADETSMIRTEAARPGTGLQTLTARFPGKITYLAVTAGDTVAVGDPILVIEAMKRENELRAGEPGTVLAARGGRVAGVLID